MTEDSFIFEYLKNAYGKNGVIAKQFNSIFEILDVDKILAMDAFYEIYSTPNHPAFLEDYAHYKDNDNQKKIHTPYQELIESLILKFPSSVVERLAFSYIFYDITVAKIQHLGRKISKKEIILALENIEVISFDLGAFMQCMTTPNIYYKQKDLKQSIQAMGGITRSRKYQAIKKQIFHDWNSSTYHSYAQCAKKHADIHQLSTKTIEKWLSKEFSKPK